MRAIFKQAALSLAVLSATLPALAEKAAPTDHQAVISASPSQTTPININAADVETFINAHIKGIGKKRAADIVTYRQQHGPFKTVDDLKNVKGISEKLITDNRARLAVQ